MTAPVIESTAQGLEGRFPGVVTADTRAGYSGYVVSADKLIDVATALRDEMGYDYLSSITGVDYIADGKLEAVYHAYRTSGGAALTLKVQVPRDDPAIPSLVSIYLGRLPRTRSLRYVWLQVQRSPNLKRILMWDGFWLSASQRLERSLL